MRVCRVNRLTLDGNQQATVFTYDTDGRVETSKDPNERITRTTYTADGQIDTIVNPDLSTTKYTYDDDGLVTAVENPDKGVTRYTYNKAGQPLTRILPGGNTTTYDYDTLGRLYSTKQNDGSTVTRTYDDAGRVTDLTYNDTDTPAVHYNYDAAGRRTAMTDGTGTTDYTYDQTGQLTTTRDSAGNTVGYTYDDGGRLTALTYPNGKTVTYQYDTASRMASATDWTGKKTTFSWTADGQRKQLTNPNGVTSINTYDNNGQISAIALARGTTAIDNYTYGYDKAGQLTTATTPAGSQNFTFDQVGQIDSVTTTGDGATGDYAITPNGLLKTLPNGTTNDYNASQQVTRTTTAGGTAVAHTYDQRGNRILTDTTATSSSYNLELPTAAYHYDQANNLTAVATAGITVTYGYDGDGLRTRRTTGSTTTNMVWTANSSMPLLLDDGTHSYLYGPTLTPYAQVDRTGAIEYLHTDALGSVRTITNAAGATIATNTYDVYGTRTHHAGSTDSAIGYTGAWTDPDTNLVYLRARDYDPVTGQFLTIDPKVDDTLQPYAYAENNPLQNTDPAGLCADCNWIENLVLKGPSQETLTTGFTGGVIDFLTGVGDAASFGLTGLAREAISPGADCFVNTNSWAYKAGEWSTYLVPGGGAVRGAAKLAVTALKSGAAKVGYKAVKNVVKKAFKRGCPRHSFAPNTRVLMGDGSTKLIRDVKPGDKVLATDPITGRSAIKSVTVTHSNQDTYLTDVTVKAIRSEADQEFRPGSTQPVIFTTANHPFWDQRSDSWVAASELVPGESILLAADGSHQLVTAVRNRISSQNMRDLTVADIHTYYVLAGSTPLLVHNCDGVQLEVTYKPEWTPAQRVAADAKVAALNSDGNLVVTAVKRSKSASSSWKRAGNTKPAGSDIDHTKDLQLGGVDDITNMNPLDLSVNRSLGSQIAKRIKQQGLQPGDRVCSIVIQERC
nr:RHS repeat-associated core domain-containing protein [Actinoplanes sp. NBRC 101535]